MRRRRKKRERLQQEREEAWLSRKRISTKDSISIAVNNTVATSSNPGSHSGDGREGLGATNKQSSESKQDEFFANYRNLRSDGYHVRNSTRKR